MITIYFNYKEDLHPISVNEIEENGNKFFDVDFLRKSDNLHEIISFTDTLRFDEKGYGPKAKSMEGMNLLISMWKSIEKHFQDDTIRCSAATPAERSFECQANN